MKGVIRELRLVSHDIVPFNSSTVADNKTGFMNAGGGEDGKSASSSQSTDTASDNNGVNDGEDANSNDMEMEILRGGVCARV